MTQRHRAVTAIARQDAAASRADQAILHTLERDQLRAVGRHHGMPSVAPQAG